MKQQNILLLRQQIYIPSSHHVTPRLAINHSLLWMIHRINWEKSRGKKQTTNVYSLLFLYLRVLSVVDPLLFLSRRNKRFCKSKQLVDLTSNCCCCCCRCLAGSSSSSFEIIVTTLTRSFGRRKKCNRLSIKQIPVYDIFFTSWHSHIHSIRNEQLQGC